MEMRPATKVFCALFNKSNWQNFATVIPLTVCAAYESSGIANK